MSNGAKILIVGDDSSHRFMLESVLGSWGYATEESDGDRTAVGMIRGCRYALVLMDIRMKALSGLDALIEIKSLDRCIPVILMTAYCNQKVCENALLNNAVAVLDKQPHLDELKTVLEQALDKKCLVK